MSRNPVFRRMRTKAYREAAATRRRHRNLQSNLIRIESDGYLINRPHRFHGDSFRGTCWRRVLNAYALAVGLETVDAQDALWFEDRADQAISENVFFVGRLGRAPLIAFAVNIEIIRDCCSSRREFAQEWRGLREAAFGLDMASDPTCFVAVLVATDGDERPRVIWADSPPEPWKLRRAS